MRLARKLTLTLIAGTLAVVAVYGYIDVQRQVSALERNMGDELSTLAHAAGAAVSRLGSEDEARQFLDAASRKGDNIRLREVRLDGDGPLGRPLSAQATREALAGGELRLVDEERLIVYRTLPGGAHAIEATQSLDEVRRSAEAVTNRALWAALLIAALGAIYVVAVGLWLVGRPVRRLSAHLQRIGDGDLDARIDPVGKDELGELAREINSMTARLADARKRLEDEQAARLATLEQLRHADRLTTVGTLAAGVAHELGTPLNVVAGHAKMIGEGEEPAAEGAAVIADQTSRMTSIIRQLLDFARRGRSHKKVADLSLTVTRSLRLLDTIARRRDATLHVEGDTQSRWVEMDEAQIQQVLTNLVLNGLQSMPNGGRVVTAVDETDRWVRVSISDEGQGIGPNELPRIFEPFFTTKSVGEGTGLGLSVSYGIVREHGGFIDVKSERGRGSTFSVHLPRAQKEAA